MEKEIKEEYDSDEVFNKEITQVEKVEPVVMGLEQMGKIWKKVTTKLDVDSVCYLCKKKLEKKEMFDIVQVPDHKIEKGMVVFTSICKSCNK